MFYREAGQYKTTYAADMAIFPIRQDRYGVALILLVAFIVIPAFGGQFLLNTMMIPFLILSLAAIGLNLLTGYTGLLSLGTGAFMGVGAYACYKLETWFPQVNILVWIVMSGFVSAAVGVAFGLPSLRIKGFYLAVATLAAQFFLEWCFARAPWLVNDNNSGAIEVPNATLFGVSVTGPNATPVTRYLVVLTIVAVMAWIASNIVHGRIGRMWMAVRDMDIAAQLIGIRLLNAKLLAFAVSSFYVGVAGALDGVPVARRRRARGVRHQPVVPDSVHHHHRRPRLDRRRLFRRDHHASHADCAEGVAADDRPADRGGAGRPVDHHDHRHPDHRVSDRRAARPRAALADRQAETARLAVPVLKRKETHGGGNANEQPPS